MLLNRPLTRSIFIHQCNVTKGPYQTFAILFGPAVQHLFVVGWAELVFKNNAISI